MPLKDNMPVCDLHVSTGGRRVQTLNNLLHRCKLMTEVQLMMTAASIKHEAEVHVEQQLASGARPQE